MALFSQVPAQTEGAADRAPYRHGHTPLRTPSPGLQDPDGRGQEAGKLPAGLHYLTERGKGQEGRSPCSGSSAGPHGTGPVPWGKVSFSILEGKKVAQGRSGQLPGPMVQIAWTLSLLLPGPQDAGTWATPTWRLKAEQGGKLEAASTCQGFQVQRGTPSPQGPGLGTPLRQSLPTSPSPSTCTSPTYQPDFKIWGPSSRAKPLLTPTTLALPSRSPLHAAQVSWVSRSFSSLQDHQGPPEMGTDFPLVSLTRVRRSLNQVLTHGSKCPL